jgi:tetratricopeptide (TPR) repeat protein
MRPSRAQLEQAVFDAFARNDFVAAERALLRISPRDADVLRLLADVALRMGKNKDCLIWLERLADSSNRPAEGLLSAGARAFDMGLPREAERLYERAKIADPTSLKPYSHLVRLYLAWQRGVDLRNLIAEGDQAGLPLEEDPLLLWLWVVGDRVHWLEDDARQWLERVVQNQPDDPYAAAGLARHWLTVGRPETASEVLDRLPKTAEPAWPAALIRAELALRAENWSDALASLRPMDAAGESQAETWALRGEVWEKCGDVDGALKAFANAAILDPWHVRALHGRARLLVQTGDVHAEEALRRAAAVDELVRRCRQLAQSPMPNLDDVREAVRSGAEIHIRWTQLVCRLVERRAVNTAWPERVKKVKESEVSPLRVPTLDSIDRTVAARRVTPPANFAPRRESSPSEGVAAVSFVETTRDLGVDFVYEYGHTPQRWLMETLGGGVAVLDFDRDDWPDLYFCQGGSLTSSGENSAPSGRLYRNRDGNALWDATDSSHAVVTRYTHGCAVSDVNNDGFADLLLCHYAGVTLLINQGDGTWRDETAPAGLVNDAWNTSAAFADLDRDGDVDLYVARYCDAPYTPSLRTCRSGERFEPCRPNAYPQTPDAVYENLGDGRFSDQSREWGIQAEGGYGLGVIAADFDDDGWPEIFVGNDTTHNFLWRRTEGSKGAAAWHDASLVAGVAVEGTGRAEASMGIACGDVDGDQRLDLFVTTFFDETSTLFQNLGQLLFDDRTATAGLSNAGKMNMGWGCQFIDADNNGWLDLAVVNGHLHDQAQLPQFFRNRGGRFHEQSATAGTYFTQPRLGRSMALWDYDADGRLDLVVSHQTEPASVLHNETPGGRSVTVRLMGVDSPRDATGATVRANFGLRTTVHLVSSQGGYLSANTSDLVIGIGDAERVDALNIRWPSGSRQVVESLSAGERVVIYEGRPEVLRLPQSNSVAGTNVP